MKARYSAVRLAATLFAAMVMGCVGARQAPASSPPPRPQKAEPAASKRPPAKVESSAEASSYLELDQGAMESTREKFNEVLDRYPRLANVVSRDPSLLTNQEYIDSTAPGLWQFLQTHPEIARNPEFFLGDRLRRVGFPRQEGGDPVLMRVLNDFWPFMVFVIIVAALLWILRVILENRRWSRLAKVQEDAHTKLLEKFGSSQELLAYIATEPGRRFLESAPIPIDLEPQPRISAPLGRILWSAQLGLILGLAGAGLLAIRNQVPDAVQPMIVFGTLGLTFGAGFVLSAVVSYVMSRHLGLFDREPGPTAAHAEPQAPRSFS